MGQFVWCRQRDVYVSYALTDRTKSFRLADLVSVDELREQLEAVRRLPLREQEKAFLRRQGFEPARIDWLDGLTLPNFRLAVTPDGQFDLSFSGSWAEAIWWDEYGQSLSVALTDTYGRGTNLTNDCGYKALSMAVKLVESAGHPTVKLSDNLAKASGPADQVKRFKRAFGYTNTDSRVCVY
jgi:nicotinic acid phosphoribosyltransferase